MSPSNPHHPFYLTMLAATVVMGVLATSFSAIFISIGLAVLSSDLGLNGTQAHWLVTIFITTSTLFLLCSATLVSKYSIRNTFMWYLGIFIVVSVIGGFSNSYWVLLLCRAIQGAVMGVLSTTAIVAMYQAYPIEQRGKAGAIFGVGLAMGPTLGPTLAGIIVENWGWRSIFFVPLPLAFISFALSPKILPNTTVPTDKAFDGRGFILLTIAIFGAMASLSYLQQNGWPAISSLLMGASVVGVSLLFWRQQQTHSAPLLNLSLFKYPTFSASAIIAFIYGMGLWGSAFFLPLYLQRAIDMSPWDTGMVMLPSGIILLLILPLGGRMADTLSPRLVVGLGLIGFSATMILIGLGVGNASFIPLALLIAISRGVGLGLMIPSLDATATRAIPSDDMADGVAVMNFLRQLGGAFSPMLIMLILEWRIAASTNVVNGYHQTFLVVGVLFLLSVVVAWRLPKIV